MAMKPTQRSLLLLAIASFTSLLGAINYLQQITPYSTTVTSRVTTSNCPPVQPIPVPQLTYAALPPGSIDTSLLSSLLHTTSNTINIDNSHQWWQSPPSEEWIQQTSYPYAKVQPSFYSKAGGISRVLMYVVNPLMVMGERLSGRRRWDDLELDREIGLFRQFLCYWLDRYTPQNRLIVTYEDLFKGSTAIPIIINFVGGDDTHIQVATCLWNEWRSHTSTSLDGTIHNFYNGSIAEMPTVQSSKVDFTIEQLTKMTNMLQELAQRYQEEEHAHSLLMQYHQEIMAKISHMGAIRTQNLHMAPTSPFHEPLEICGRRIPFSLSTEIEIAQHYTSECPLFSTNRENDSTIKPKGLLLMKGYERFGRTGNNLIEFLHALQYGRENNVLVGIMLDSWPMALITKFWMAFPTDNLHNEGFLTDGILEWKDHIEQAFCIKVFLNDDEVVGYDNIIEMTARELFMFRYKADVKEYVQFQLHNIRMLFRSYNIGVGKDVKNRNVGDLCSVIDGVFGAERQSVKYSVIHSRSLEGAPGLRLLGILSGTSGCDPVAALNMEPEYIKAILSPLGLLQNPILFISDNQRPEILERLLADADIGPQIRVVSPELSWVGGDLAAAIMATAFIGNPASTFSGFIAKSRIALGFDHNYLFRVKKDGQWIDSCEERCIFYKWVMRSMA